MQLCRSAKELIFLVMFDLCWEDLIRYSSRFLDEGKDRAIQGQVPRAIRAVLMILHHSRRA